MNAPRPSELVIVQTCEQYTVSDSCFCFSVFSVEGGNSTDVKIHSSEVKMYSADVNKDTSKN